MSASFVLASFRPSTIPPRGYASCPSLAAALTVEGRVSARRGWVGDNSSHFEPPAGEGLLGGSKEEAIMLLSES